MAVRPENSRAINIQLTEPKVGEFNLHRPDLRLKNTFLTEYARVSLFKNSGRIYQPYGQNLLFSGNIYAIRRNSIFPVFAPSLEYSKRASITDFGVVGTLEWPLIRQDNWSIYINGKVSGSQQYPGTLRQRNRWNFEHQLGWNANYHFSDTLQVSLGAYRYRIINDFQYDNPAQSYINSSGGFTTLHFQF